MLQVRHLTLLSVINFLKLAIYCVTSGCNKTTNVNCPTTGKWRIPFSHTYTRSGYFNITVVASNKVSNNSITIMVQVQSLIRGFRITYPTNFTYYPFGANYFVAFAADQGSDFDFTLQVDGTVLVGPDSWSDSTISGNVTVPWTSLNGFVGVKNLTITVQNDVNPPITIFYACQFEYMFTGFTFTPDPAFFVTNSSHTLSFSWSNASHFNYTLDLGDNVRIFSYKQQNLIIDPNNPSTLTYPSLSYSLPGTYLVKIIANNHVDKQTFPFNIVVENALCCIKLVTDFVGTLTKVGGDGVPGVFSLIWPNPTQPYPTNAVYDYDFGNTGGKLTGTPYLNNKPNQTQSNNYFDYTTYTVTVFLHNNISNMSLSTTIVIVVGFANVQFDMLRLQPYIGLEPHNYYLITNEVAQFAMTLDQGTNYNLTMDFDDQSTYFTDSVNATAIYYNHSFAHAGNYSPSMLIQNNAQREFHKLPIPVAFPQYLVVEDPIQCFNFTIIPGYILQISYAQKNTGTNLTVQLFTDPSCGIMVGTNPRYIVDWGDLTTKKTGRMPAFNSTGTGNFFTNIVHVYSKTDIYNMNLTIWNEVSSVTFMKTIEVYEMVTNVTITPKYMDLQNISEFSGFVPTPNTTTPDIVYFPLENLVVLHASVIFGSYVQYTWSFSDNYTVGNDYTVNRTFPKPGIYYVNVTISNQPTYGSKGLKIIIERSLKNLTIVDNSPWPRFDTFNYQIAMDSVPTDACYFFDFIDPSPNATCRYLFFGNLSTCQQYFTYNTSKTYASCKISQSYSSITLEKDTANGTQQARFTLNRKFYTLGRKNISLTVVNRVFRQTFYYSTYVTSDWCQFPKVIVRDLNRCLTSDNCKCFQLANGPNYQCPSGNDQSYAQGDRIGYIKDQILFNADVIVTCRQNQSGAGVWYNWTMQEIDNNGIVTKTVTSLLKGLNYNTFSSKTLVVPPNTLTGGRLYLTLTVRAQESEF